MRINELAKLTGISKRNIHFYIKEGLLTPVTNTENGYYEFSEDEQQKLCIIRDLRKLNFSLSVIQSMLEHPDTIGLYVNGQITDLRKQCRQIEAALNGLNNIVNELPFHTTLDHLQTLAAKATAAIEPVEEFEEIEEFTERDMQTVSLFVWAPFLESNQLSEYQEFLWEKQKKLAMKYALEDYKNIKEFLLSLEQPFSDEMYVTEVPHYKRVAAMSEEEAVDFGYEIIKCLKNFICDDKAVQFWKTNYKNLYMPMCHIHETPMVDVMKELSPMYGKYMKNMFVSINIAYEYLHTAEGKKLYQDLRERLEGYLNIEDYKHVQLIQLYSMDVTPLEAL